ncbi:MAG: hypothetical protein H8K04_06645 [Nitrospira sp.]
MDLLVLCLIVVMGWSVWMGFRRSSRQHKDGAGPHHHDTVTQQSATLSGETAALDNTPDPHSRVFTAEDERHAFEAGQPIWIRYEDKSGVVTERVVEIYRPSEDEVIYTWCRRKRAPRTFVRRKISHWRLLPERFDFDPIVAQYWNEEWLRERFEKNPWRRWLRRQPKEIADRYKE